MTVAAASASVSPAQLDWQPPGERYYRHPGDLVRLIVWTTAAVALATFIGVGTRTTDGLALDLGRAFAHIPLAPRELLLALAQVLAVMVPAVVLVLLLWQRRFRRIGVVLLGAAAGAGLGWLTTTALDLGAHLPTAVSSGTWVASARFPSLMYLAGLAAAGSVGKPWISQSWRRAMSRGMVFTATAMAVAGSAGVPDVLLILVMGALAAALVLVAVGAPNRRPSPAAVQAGLEQAGLVVDSMQLVRAEGGRSQLYVSNDGHGTRRFVKAYARDSRDADVLYRGYRTLVLRGSDDDWSTLGLRAEVEHHALMLFLAERAGVACPTVSALTELDDGSVALALSHVDGPPLDSLDDGAVDAALLTALWREVASLHAGRLAHRALRAGNVLVAAGRPVIIDLGFGAESASPRLLAIDRAELLASLSALVGVDAAVTSASSVLNADDLAAALPYLQPLALSASTRSAISKSQLKELRAAVAASTGEELPPLEQIVRVKPRSILTVAALAGAFYILLPQLANVGDSVAALRHANYFWLVVCLVMSIATYLASAIGMAGGIPDRLPPVPLVMAQMASSFVNRVTPANVGGMALNVRFLQKSGVESGAAVAGIGLNVLAGGIVHLLLLVMFVALAGQSGGGAFKIPTGSKSLVIVAVVLVAVGVLAATRWGRRLFRTKILTFLKQSWTSIAELSRRPVKLVELFGGSLAITMAYVAALAAAVAAFGGGLTFAEVGAVYLGASVLAAASPTPGGLGAIEAALVAGLTGLGMAAGPAVAAVLGYRLATYWFPILPGWISFQVLERRNLI
jgi:undecaprenyl-diphosphatase